jgi:hypothetical protein
VPVDRSSSGLAALLGVFDRLLQEYSDGLTAQIRDNPRDLLLVRDQSDVDQIQAAVRDRRRRLGCAAER